MEELVISCWKHYRNNSIIWKGFGRHWHFISENMKWHFGNGSKILIGDRLMTGMDSHRQHMDEMVLSLNQRGLFYLQEVIKDWEGEVPR